MRSVSAEALPAKGPRRPRVKLSLQPGPKGTWLIFLTRPVGNACQPFLGTGLFSLMFPAQQALDSFPSGSLLGRIVEHFLSQCIVYHCLFPWGALYLARWPSTILYTQQGVWGRGVGSLDSWPKKKKNPKIHIKYHSTAVHNQRWSSQTAGNAPLLPLVPPVNLGVSSPPYFLLLRMPLPSSHDACYSWMLTPLGISLTFSTTMGKWQFSSSV